MINAVKIVGIVLNVIMAVIMIRVVDVGIKNYLLHTPLLRDIVVIVGMINVVINVGDVINVIMVGI